MSGFFARFDTTLLVDLDESLRPAGVTLSFEGSYGDCYTDAGDPITDDDLRAVVAKAACGWVDGLIPAIDAAVHAVTDPALTAPHLTDPFAILRRCTGDVDPDDFYSVPPVYALEQFWEGRWLPVMNGDPIRWSTKAAAEDAGRRRFHPISKYRVVPA